MPLIQYSSDFSDAQDALNSQGTNFSTLLNRSRSSRQRKPLSIRVAMQQAATYSNMTRTTPTPSHSANPSVSTTHSRLSTIPSGTPSTSATSTPTSVRNSSIQNLSPIAADLYDGATQATTSNKKSNSESSRRKRPAFLALQPEQSESTVEGRHIHTKRDKDQLRKSSPTVGDQFTFVPGEPPPEDAPPQPKVSFKEEPQEEPLELAHRVSDPQLHSEPPNGPLPKPPSRSPSRSRSPGRAPAKTASRAPSRAEASRGESSRAPSRVEASRGESSRAPSRVETSRGESSRAPSRIEASRGESSRAPSRAEASRGESSRAPSRAELSKAVYNDPSPAISPPEKQESILDEQLDQSITELEEENRKSQSPSPQDGEAYSPPPVSEVAEMPQPRKQKSSSSVRSQIMTLPETARLRKQASAEVMLRKQPSAEMLAVRRADASIPALPTPMHGHVRGNAFGKQGSHASLQSGIRTAPPRTSSLEGLSERSRKRSATDLAPPANPDVIPLPLRPRRSISRSASDAHRPPNLRMRRQPSNDRDFYHSPNSATLHTPASSQPPTSSASESWPLTPELANTPTDHFHPSTRNIQIDHTEYQERVHSRNTSGTSFPQSKLLSPEHTPRASRTSTPHTGTPRRSRSNTLLTIASEAAERELAEDAISIAGSAAPSVMSAQWYRPPRERLGLGTRVSRSEILPWELGAQDDEGPPVPPKPKTPPLKTKKFSMFPARAPSRLKEGYESPPRSPLLTEKFLVDVKDSLPESPRQRGGTLETQDRPSTSMKSRDGAMTPDWARKKQKKEKKEKKDRVFPTLGELVSEYKGMTNTWYTSAYAEEAQQQKLEKEARRPATGNTSLSSSSKHTTAGGSGSGGTDSRSLADATTIANPSSSKSQKSVVATPRPSRDMGSSVTSSSGSSKDQQNKDKKQKKKSTVFPTVKEMWSEYKSMGNQWYSAPYRAETPRDIASPQSGFS
jgi:hypothetical protein